MAPTTEQEIAALEALMARAVAAEDFEEAARLRDRLVGLRGVSGVRRQAAGSMGLGTDLPAHVPPEGWVRPERPDPMTAGAKRGGRRRRRS